MSLIKHHQDFISPVGSCQSFPVNSLIASIFRSLETKQLNVLDNLWGFSVRPTFLLTTSKYSYTIPPRDPHGVVHLSAVTHLFGESFPPIIFHSVLGPLFTIPDYDKSLPALLCDWQISGL